MASPSTEIEIRAEYEEGTDDQRFFLYSCNNGGGPEFLALHVPIDKADRVARTMEFLAKRQVKHGQSAYNERLYFLTNEIKDERKAQLSETHMTLTDPNSPFFELIPRFDCCSSGDNWGSRPAAPHGREDLVDAIINVWRDKNRLMFILFVDGNTNNWFPGNWKGVDLAVALRHVDDWKVNWDMYLNTEQTTYVRENNQYFSKLAKVLYRIKEVCAGCGLIDVGRLMRCKNCHNAWYCSVTCQRADWSNHKTMCKTLQAYRNNNPNP